MEKTDPPKEETPAADGNPSHRPSQASQTSTKPTNDAIPNSTAAGSSRPASKVTDRPPTTESRRASRNSLKPTSEVQPTDPNDVSAEPKSSQSKRESRAESGMSMTEEEAKAVLQEFLKQNRKKPPSKVKEDSNDPTGEHSGGNNGQEKSKPTNQNIEANDGQVDQLVDRIVEKLKPYLNPGALEVIDEKDEDEEQEDEPGKEAETNEEMKPERSPSQRSLKTAEKVQSVLDEVEKLRNLIEVGRSMSRDGGSQEKELTNVILAMKRKEAKLGLRMKEVEQTEEQLKSRKEILDKKDEDVEKYVRELVENTNKIEEKREELEEKELEINKRLKDAEVIKEKSKATEDGLKYRAEKMRKDELDIKDKIADIERREKQVENDKRVNSDQRDRLRIIEERNNRKERDLKNDEQRIRDLESEIKMQDMDLKFRLEEAKRKEEEIKRKMEDMEDENDKLDRVLRKIQSEKRRLAEDFRTKQEELTDLSARVRKFINDWNRRVGDKVSDQKGNGKYSLTDQSLESAISEVESERRMLELEAELVEQQLELERKGRLLLEQDKVLAELGHLQPLDGGPLLTKRKDDSRLPPLGGKSHYQSPAERSRREDTNYASQRDPNTNGNERRQDERRDSLNLESVKSDEDEDHDTTYEGARAGPRHKPQPPFVFKFTLLSPGQHPSEVAFRTKPIKTIRELKLAMKNQEGIPVNWQRYYSDSRALTDTTLLQRITGRSQLRLTIDRGNKVIKVVFPDKEDIKIPFDLQESFHSSKIRIFQATGIFPSKLRLFISGVEMKGKQILGDYIKGGVTYIGVDYEDD
ncbi:uncharacterized protein [Apostichopus japonicus]|uniref:uncharacterized protein n=1 Tax=Stichopus japonicus TaxID=307972 RepID=UPI003AB6889E